VSDESRRLLALLLDLAEQRAHHVRPAFRPVRFYVRRNPHRTYMRFVHDRHHCR
jgi:hypothetical protein